MLEQLQALVRKPQRRIIGLMSGTSMDGIDAALVRIQAHGLRTQVELERFLCHPYENVLRARLLQVASGAACTATEWARLHFQVAASFAQAALEVIDAAGATPHDVDLVASHGQTLAHNASPDAGDDAPAATWQAGDLQALAAWTGLPVVGDFRSADVALGGTGAPLVPYADYLLRRSARESRLLLNLGGIANFTYLGAGGTLDDLLAWDLGPGNMLLDGLAERLLGTPCDWDGAAAARGRIDHAWVADLLEDDFFVRTAPKSAGREEFGAAYLDRFVTAGRGRGADDASLLASALELTVQSVVHALRIEPLAAVPLDAVYATGGGRANPTLMRRLAAAVAPARVEGIEKLGVPADAKEALDFAVLGNEALFAHATNIQQVTGADRPCVLGSLALAGFVPRPLQ